MSRLIILLAVLAAACSKPAPTSKDGTGIQGNLPGATLCERQVTRPTPFTQPGSNDTIEARSFGATCAAAVVVWTLRTKAGKVLWTYAAPYDSLAVAEDLNSVRAMDAFLARWANVTVDDTAASPFWPAEQDSAPEGWGPTGSSMFSRATYEQIRQDRLPRLCVPTSLESTACIFYDARAEAVDVHFRYGP